MSPYNLHSHTASDRSSLLVKIPPTLCGNTRASDNTFSLRESRSYIFSKQFCRRWTPFDLLDFVVWRESDDWAARIRSDFDVFWMIDICLLPIPNIRGSGYFNDFSLTLD